MASGSNAGIRRNRRPTGTVAVERKVYLSEETNAALERARVESGNLSVGLYLELLTKRITDEHGNLPVVPLTDQTKEPPVAAA